MGDAFWDCALFDEKCMAHGINTRGYNRSRAQAPIFLRHHAPNLG
jgi:hypothetical protein